MKAKINDNWNRECSFVASRGGFVIHSGVHRSTAFVHPSICADAYRSACYWLRRGARARDAWITQIVGEAPLDAAEAAAFAATRPGWKVNRIATGDSSKADGLEATRPSGALTLFVGAGNWRQLHQATRKA